MDRKKRRVDDWISLCPSCHRLYDNGKLELGVAKQGRKVEVSS